MSPPAITYPAPFLVFSFRCSLAARAVSLLDLAGVDYTYVDVGANSSGDFPAVRLLCGLVWWTCYFLCFL